MKQFPLTTDKDDIFNSKNNELEQYNMDKEKNNIISYLETNMEEKEEEIDSKKDKILLLEIITSISEEKGKKIKIDKNGYSNGLRGVKDGITYFGYQEFKKNKKEVRKKYLYILEYINRLYS